MTTMASGITTILASTETLTFNYAILETPFKGLVFETTLKDLLMLHNST